MCQLLFLETGKNRKLILNVLSWNKRDELLLEQVTTTERVLDGLTGEGNSPFRDGLHNPVHRVLLTSQLR